VSVPRHHRNPRRAYDAHGQEIVPPTVGNLRAQGETTAAIYCEAVSCGHSGVISTDGLPADLPFPDIALRCRCSVCGSRRVRAMRDMAAHYERMRETGWACDPFAKTVQNDKSAPEPKLRGA
jgi:hypothetical protein